MDFKVFKERRGRLLAKIGDSSIAIIPSAPVCYRTIGTSWPYRQNSDFLYLTGFKESNALIVLISHEKLREFILFSRKKDSTLEMWEGEIIGQDKACSVYGADRAFSIDKVDKVLRELFTDTKNIYYSDSGGGECFKNRIKKWKNTFSNLEFKILDPIYRKCTCNI